MRYLIFPIIFALCFPDAVFAADRSGEEVFKATCATCHFTGVSGAPKLGSEADWKPRITQGKQTLYQHALSGYKAMPAHGACMSCSDREIKSAVDYMVSKAQ
jgi:cytochrome c5